MRAGRGERLRLEQTGFAHAELARDRGEFFPVGASGDADQFELVGMRGNDAQSAFTNGTGGAQQDHTAAGK